MRSKKIPAQAGTDILIAKPPCMMDNKTMVGTNHLRLLRRWHVTMYKGFSRRMEVPKRDEMAEDK